MSCRDLHYRAGFSAPIDVIPNFVPSTIPEREGTGRESEGTPEKPYFLFVGRLEKIKGLQDLIPLFRFYPKASLWIAGTGAYEKRLRKMARESENIRFFGFLDETSLGKLYKNATALLVPSLCHENFANVILEGFRQKTPAIVSNQGGMPELIEESGGGHVYDTKGDLLAVISRLMKDPSYRNELGRCGYDAYRKKWTAEAHLEQYFRLIGEVAKEDHAGSAPS
jgi:glycosyltransferase involved in cell wall biosynthesis